MSATQGDASDDSRRGHYLPALLILLGFLLIVPGVYLFVLSQPGFTIPAWARSIDSYALERTLVSAGVALTFFGLVALEDLLRDSGDRVLSRLGLASFGLATVLWLKVNALSLSEGFWVAELESYFIVFSLVAGALFSGAILRTKLLPRWVGIVAMAWSIVTLVFVAPRGRIPFLYKPAVLLIGVALLFSKQ